MTTDPTAVMTASPPEVSERHPAWRILTEPFTSRFWREFGYFFLTYLLGGVGLAYVLTAASVAPVLLIFIVGVPILGLIVLGGRVLGRLQRGMVRVLLHEEIPAPSAFRGKEGFLPFVVSTLADGVGWRALAYQILKAPFVVIGGYALIVWTGMAIGFATYPVWWAVFVPENADAQGRVRHSGM
ncbi:MAG TPA: sensor domain-containing protein, partial [Iamia sp.]|nr:sensor domain-containing protein [Iamia sp.]